MHKRHNQRTEAVVSNESTQMSQLAKRRETTWDCSTHVCGRTEVAIDVDSQVANGVDRLNKSAGNWQRTVGALRQLTSGRVSVDEFSTRYFTNATVMCRFNNSTSADH